MDGRPGELTTLNLLLPLIEGRELLVVLIEEVEEVLEDFINLLVDPRSVSKLDNKVERVNHGKVLEANLVILQVVEDQADHTDNLLFVGEIEDLGNVLDDVQLEVLEVLQGELFETKNPEAAADVVGDLGVLLAVSTCEKLLEHVEASLLHERFGELVDLEEVHERVGEGVTRELLGAVLVGKDRVKEGVGLFSLFSLSNARVSDQNGKSVCGHVTNRSLLEIRRLSDEAVQDTDAVKLLLRRAGSALLQEGKESDATTVVLNDSIDKSEGPSDEIGLAADLADDLEKVSHELLVIFKLSFIVEEGSLTVIIELKEGLDAASSVSGQLTLSDEVVDHLEVGCVVEDFSADRELLVGEDASVHKDLVGDLFAFAGV